MRGREKREMLEVTNFLLVDDVNEDSEDNRGRELER